MFYTIQEGEKKLGSWTINYIAPDGGRHLGQLDVTDKNLYYDGKFDMSFSGLVKEALFVNNGSSGYLCIPKSLIKNVEVKKSFMKKQVLVTLEDDQVHTFDYGAMSVDKLLSAIKQQQQKIGSIKNVTSFCDDSYCGAHPVNSTTKKLNELECCLPVTVGSNFYAAKDSVSFDQHLLKKLLIMTTG